MMKLPDLPGSDYASLNVYIYIHSPLELSQILRSVSSILRLPSMNFLNEDIFSYAGIYCKYFLPS